MTLIPKSEIINGNTIQASDITNIVDALDGSQIYDLIIGGGVSIGGNTTGTSSLSVGSSNQSTGDYSFSVGTNNIASGESSIAVGRGNTASGLKSFAHGFAAQAISDYSVAFGRSTTANSEYQFVVGQNNTSDTTSLFIVGSGFEDTGKDAFKVTNSSSILIPQTQSVKPTWSGSDGEIIPATVGGRYWLYMWMNGAWRSGSFA